LRQIFRAEILLVARVHPETPGKAITRAQFDEIWAASVRLMRRAFTLGSIVTVSPEEAAAVGRPGLRRWIYNSARCGQCGGAVKSWSIQARTCYACEQCQPSSGGSEAPRAASAPTLFNSHCAAESLADRLGTPQKLRVTELREALQQLDLPADGKKAQLVARLEEHYAAARAGEEAARAQPSAASGSVDGGAATAAAAAARMRSARAAAADKAAVSESRAVEHVAEMEDLDDGAPEWVALPGEADADDLDLDDGLQVALLESAQAAAAAAATASPAAGRKRIKSATAVGEAEDKEERTVKSQKTGGKRRKAGGSSPSV
jgi:hypothetical protein